MVGRYRVAATRHPGYHPVFWRCIGCGCVSRHQQCYSISQCGACNCCCGVAVRSCHHTSALMLVSIFWVFPGPPYIAFHTGQIQNHFGWHVGRVGDSMSVMWDTPLVFRTAARTGGIAERWLVTEASVTVRSLFSHRKGKQTVSRYLSLNATVNCPLV